MENKKKPVFKSRSGVIDCAVWKQEGEKGDFLTVSIIRSYKDGEEWKQTNSFRINDIPVIQVVLQKAFEYAKFDENSKKEE